MQTLESIGLILGRVQYKDWQFIVRPKGSGFTLKIVFLAPDNDCDSDKLLLQHCRKYYISPHMTDTEVVKTCFIAVRQAEEHELAEKFTYRGARVFNPHYDIEELVTFSQACKIDKRINESIV